MMNIRGGSAIQFVSVCRRSREFVSNLAGMFLEKKKNPTVVM